LLATFPPNDEVLAVPEEDLAGEFDALPVDRVDRLSRRRRTSSP